MKYTPKHRLAAIACFRALGKEIPDHAPLIFVGDLCAKRMGYRGAKNRAFAKIAILKFLKAAKWPEASAPALDAVAPASDRFYMSREWRQLRYLVLKNTGGRCECCGASASDGIQLHVDHIKPRSVFPELALAIDNLQILCEDCNFGKGAWDATDWRSHMRNL